MNRSSNSHSSMFLMEMMVAIMLFSLASSVCLRMFATCRQISGQTRDLNMAVYQAGNAAELIKCALSDGQAAGEAVFPGCIQNEYPQSTFDSSHISVYYDEMWNPCQKTGSTFHMDISQTRRDGLLLYDIHVLPVEKGKEAVYTLTLKLHEPQRP
ncbi:hypothetical protein AALC25_07415 [Lachnospiraceae bacterium 29-84]